MTDNPAVDAYWTEYERLWNQTVDALTTAVRLDHPERRQLDFAGFVYSALRATLANVGSVDDALSALSESPEADQLDGLLRSCVGTDPIDPDPFHFEHYRADLVQFRTERVIVPLNIEQLVDDAWQDSRGEGSLLPYSEAIMGAEGSDELRESVYRRYAESYRAYAERFAAAVLAATLNVPGLRSELVSVQVEADPDYSLENGHVTNPIEYEGDGLAWHLWSTALASVGMPAVPSDATEM